MRVLGAILMLMLLAGPATAGDVVVRRDTFGVPHIFADSDADMAYALGYAQADDRVDQIFANWRLALGRMAEVAGPDLVEQDWMARLAGNEAVVKAGYPALSPDVRELCESYVEGVQAWLAEHPERRPATYLEPQPWMVAAVGRLIILGWPLERGRDELERRGEASFFSNQWAVAPPRTADGHALLLIDPHIPWDGPFRFYEFRAHTPNLDVSGFGPVGTPALGLGHNAFLGWAMTTGGPDTTDVYVLELHPDDPRRYRYDGEWRTMTADEVVIDVAGAEPLRRTLERSHLGPILAREAGKAYALACPYLDQMGPVEQLYRMMRARNLDELRAALAMNQLMEQNVMAADVEGNLFYLRTGRTPIRPAGDWDWSRPVPGNTSATAWQGIHPIDDLPQVLNPPTGWMQNCNIGADQMATGDWPLRREDYPAYLFGDYAGESNSRGRRANELLAAHDRMTLEQAQAIAFDDHAEGAEAWIDALLRATEIVDYRALLGSEVAEQLDSGLDRLAHWDGRMSRDSFVPTLYRAVRTLAREREFDLPAGRPINEREAARLLQLLVEAGMHLYDTYGDWAVAYGRIHRLERGDQSWPLSGGESGGGQTLRAISTRQVDGRFVGRAGQNWVQLVQLAPGNVRSWSITPYGQSDDPASPHFADQAPLFAEPTLKPTWFQPAELEGHVESEVRLRR